MTRRYVSNAVETRGDAVFWDKSTGSLMIGWWQPAYRGRESDAGFYAELQEPGQRC